MSEEGPRIAVSRNGPYLVSGGPPLAKWTIVTDEDGESVAWREDERYPDRERYSLCRCGHSCDKPFCDGSHVAAGFDGTETDSRKTYAERSDRIEGPGVVLMDATDLCAEARFCRANGALWRRVGECSDPDTRRELEGQACMCPSGRYVMVDAETGVAAEPGPEPSIGLIEDPELGPSGGVWVRGGIPIESADGFIHEVRNRVTLCRCGQSKNKPFCDGTHCEVGFSDGA